MHFILDENPPRSVAVMLESHGHRVKSILDYTPRGAVDEVVATIAMQVSAVLVTFDEDFKKRIDPKVGRRKRRRFLRLHRIWMRCSKPQAAQRLESVLDFVEREYEIARTNGTHGMALEIGQAFLRTER